MFSQDVVEIFESSDVLKSTRCFKQNPWDLHANADWQDVLDRAVVLLGSCHGLDEPVEWNLDWEQSAR